MLVLEVQKQRIHTNVSLEAFATAKMTLISLSQTLIQGGLDTHGVMIETLPSTPFIQKPLKALIYKKQNNSPPIEQAMTYETANLAKLSRTQILLDKIPKGLQSGGYTIELAGASWNSNALEFTVVKALVNEPRHEEVPSDFQGDLYISIEKGLILDSCSIAFIRLKQNLS